MKYYKSIIPILGREKFDEKETQKKHSYMKMNVIGHFIVFRFRDGIRIFYQI